MKLIDLLVKELPNRGGWPEAANYVVQDYDGTVKFSKSINFLHIKAGEWCSNEDGDDWIYGDRPCEGNFHHYITANDWKASIVTREQYEAALAASKAVVGHDGWVDWHGGECPVDSDAIVEVKFRNPSSNQFNSDRAGDFYWPHDGLGYDIIAYRLRQPAKSEQVCDDAAETDDEADLNECIGHDVDVPEWNGDGLPPVGTICMANFANGWTDVKVAYIGDEGGCREALVFEVKTTKPAWADEFRPLRTEAEKAREAVCHEIASMIGRGTFFEDAERIYDAIAAGKIPGVKLEVK